MWAYPYDAAADMSDRNQAALECKQSQGQSPALTSQCSAGVVTCGLEGSRASQFSQCSRICFPLVMHL